MTETTARGGAAPEEFELKSGDAQLLVARTRIPLVSLQVQFRNFGSIPIAFKVTMASAFMWSF